MFEVRGLSAVLCAPEGVYKRLLRIALESTHPERVHAIEMLGRLRYQRAKSALLRIFRVTADSGAAGQALHALGFFDEADLHSLLVRTSLNSADLMHRIGAVQGLAVEHRQFELSHFIQILESPDTPAPLLYAAFDGLSLRRPDEVAGALGAVRHYISSYDDDVRIDAIRLLGEIGDASDVELLRELTADPLGNEGHCTEIHAVTQKSLNMLVSRT